MDNPCHRFFTRLPYRHATATHRTVFSDTHTAPLCKGCHRKDVRTRYLTGSLCHMHPQRNCLYRACAGYILHRIHQYQEHVSNATTEQKPLDFLKTYNVTHILLSEEDVLNIASLHTDEQDEYLTSMVRLLPRSYTGSTHARLIPAHKKTLLSFVEIDFYHKPTTATVKLKNGKTVNIGYVKSDSTAEKKMKNTGECYIYSIQKHTKKPYTTYPRRFGIVSLSNYFSETNIAKRLCPYIHNKQETQKSKYGRYSIRQI